jgi:uncharacterized protein
MAEPPISIRETAAGSMFRVRVVPRSSRSEIAGVTGDALKLRITAPPVEGKANEECVRLLAEFLGVKKAKVQITAGHESRTKTIAVEGVKPDKIASLIAVL